MKKIVNFASVLTSYFFSRLGLQILKNTQPYFISIEPVNYCNLRCPECAVGQQPLQPENYAQMDFPTFSKLIDETKNTLMHAIFYFQGEPLINKHLATMINYAHKANIYCSTSTNAQFLTPNIARELVLSGLDKIIVSIDGSTQEVYEKYRVGANLEKTIKAIEYIVNCKKELKSKTPLVEMQFIVFKTNQHQMSDMQVIAKKLKVDVLTFKSAQLSNDANFEKLLTTIPRYARYVKSNNVYRLKGRQPNHCFRLWSGAVVNANGQVLPCCFDKKSEYSFGYLSDGSFSDCWHNKNASNFRDAILKNRKQFDMCRNCNSRY